MPYTYRSLAFVWFIMSALFAVSVSGVPANWWLILLLAVALATPVLVLRNPAQVTIAAPGRSSNATAAPASSPLDLGGTDVLRWENEGGARRIRPLRV
jgi:hypothetical protein